MFRWCVFIFLLSAFAVPAQAQLLDASAISGNWRPADGSCRDKSTLFMLDRLLVFPSGEPALGVTWKDAPVPTAEATSTRDVSWISLIGESRGTYNDAAQSHDVRFVYDGGERAHLETPETHIWMTRCPGTQAQIVMPEMALAYIDDLGFGAEYATGSVIDRADDAPATDPTETIAEAASQRPLVDETVAGLSGEAEALNQAVLAQSSIRADSREPGEPADMTAETGAAPGRGETVARSGTGSGRSPRAAAAITRDYGADGYAVQAVMAAAEANGDDADFLNEVSLSNASPERGVPDDTPVIEPSADPARTGQSEPEAPVKAAAAFPDAPGEKVGERFEDASQASADAIDGNARTEQPEIRLASAIATAEAYVAPMVPDRDSPPAAHETFASLTSSLAGGWYDVDLEEDERRGRASCEGVTVVTADLEGQGSFFFKPVPGIEYGDDAADIRVGEIGGFGENTYNAERRMRWTMEDAGGSPLPLMVFDQGPVRSGEQIYKVAFAERQVDGRGQPTIVLEQLTTGYKREYARCEY